MGNHQQDSITTKLVRSALQKLQLFLSTRDRDFWGMIQESTVNEFLYSTDKSKLDTAYIHKFLTNSYWAKNISEAVVKMSIENSLCVGIYQNDKQVGFARLVTDFATFAYLADVFVDESYRGRGASKGLMQFILSFSFIGGLRRVVLATRDAHGLYAQFGFLPFERPDRWMEIHHPNVYQNTTPSAH